MSMDCRKHKDCLVPDCTIKHHSFPHRLVNEKDLIATQLSVSFAVFLLSQNLVWKLFQLLLRVVTVILAVPMH